MLSEKHMKTLTVPSNQLNLCCISLRSPARYVTLRYFVLVLCSGYLEPETMYMCILTRWGVLWDEGGRQSARGTKKRSAWVFGGL